MASREKAMDAGPILEVDHLAMNYRTKDSSAWTVDSGLFAYDVGKSRSPRLPEAIVPR